MKSSRVRALSPEIVIHLNKIFSDKEWPLGHDRFGVGPRLFDRFCLLLSRLSKTEQALVITLTEDFLRCTLADYPKLMYTALGKVDPVLVGKAERVYILPLISPEDLERGQSKSGTAMLYVTWQGVAPYLDQFKGKKVVAFDSLSVFVEKHRARQNTLILFIDDFIGSGTTACKALDYYCSNYMAESDSVIVVALIAQQQGIQFVQDLGFDIVAAHIRRRGISESKRIGNIEAALAIMDQIESRLSVRPDYRRGYAQSEALVTMIRTPNNTFPVYWCPRTKDHKPWPAPFRR